MNVAIAEAITGRVDTITGWRCCCCSSFSCCCEVEQMCRRLLVPIWWPRRFSITHPRGSRGSFNQLVIQIIRVPVNNNKNNNKISLRSRFWLKVNGRRFIRPDCNFINVIFLTLNTLVWSCCKNNYHVTLQKCPYSFKFRFMKSRYAAPVGLKRNRVEVPFFFQTP